MRAKRSDFGNVQILHSWRGVLKIAMQKGFANDFLTYFETVGAEDAAVVTRH
jgi:hypothetical protein